MKFIVLVAAFCLIAVVASEADLTIGEGGKYNFLYSVDDAGSHKREEKSNDDGTVSGSYSYVDPNGDLRKVEYKAGAGIGFQASGDISVDKKTAEKAAELAELAPKAPVAETTELKAPISPFTLPLYALPGIHTPVVAPHPYAVHHPLAYPYAHAPFHYYHF